MMPRVLVVSMLLGLTLPALAQPNLDDAGPQLKVPSAETDLFFAKQPQVGDGSVFVPLAAVERWLKTKVEGNRKGEFHIAYYGETRVPVDLTLWVGERRARISRAEVPLDHAPKVIDEETYVPLKFIAEAVGVWVEHVGRHIRLRKPDLDWECWLAIPPHALSLEGKMTALAVARRPEKLKRVENVALSPDTMSGHVVIAEPSEDGKTVVRYAVHYTRDKTGWHFASEDGPIAARPAGD